MDSPQYHSVCNDTKWRELQAIIVSLNSEHWPKFRSKYLANGYVSPWDCEWFYHFSEGGYEDIEWVELRWDQSMAANIPHGILKIGLIGERVGDVLRIYGYVPNGTAVEKLSLAELGSTVEADIAAVRPNSR